MSMLADRIPNIPEVPFEVRKAFANAGDPEEEFRAHTALWREVVARSVMDALGFTGQSEPDRHNAILLDARVWLRMGESLEEVFDRADLPLEIIRESMLQEFAKTKPPLKTRREPTKKLSLTLPVKKVTGESKKKRKPDGKHRTAKKAPRVASSKGLRKPRKKVAKPRRVPAKKARKKTR